jgi:hypothetical protein
MSELINHITPLTRGIIWLISEESPSNLYYSQIDYLLDGLLTSNLVTAKNLSSRLVIGENFNKPLYVMIIREIKRQEIDSFVSLIKKDLGPENDIAVIDETNTLEKLKNELKDIHTHLRSI